MKRIYLTLAAIVTVAICTAQTRFNTVIVHAQGVTLRLSDSDIKQIRAVSHDKAVNDALTTGQTIRYNDTADKIIAYYQALHNKR